MGPIISFMGCRAQGLGSSGDVLRRLEPNVRKRLLRVRAGQPAAGERPCVCRGKAL